MREKRIVLVNDVTGLSRCSVACQLPIISAMGIETAFVPTAILSINTYHKDFFFDDYTSKMNDYIETYKKMNIDFDGICSGFLGSAKQIEIVKEFFKDFKTEKNFRKKGIIMGLLWRTEKHYRGKKRKSYIRSCPLFSAGGIFLRDPDHAYDPDGQAKADPGSSRVCGRRDQPVCLCFLSL